MTHAENIALGSHDDVGINNKGDIGDTFDEDRGVGGGGVTVDDEVEFKDELESGDDDEFKDFEGSNTDDELDEFDELEE
jgi:hypothetical protein